jgi:23S rRNA (cytidine2498-2'-O)-methyltransferase
MTGTESSKQIILTSDPGSSSIVWREIQAADPGSRLLQWLAPGIGWVELGKDWASLVQRLRAHPPVFCRHVCPVQRRVPLKQETADLDLLAQAGASLAPHLDPAHSFSVQTRLLGSGWPYKRYEVNERLAHLFVARGATLDVREPQQVASVVLTPAWGYLGLSRAADNLSDWAGGVRRFKREPEQISRAEFKLLEALELFALRLPAGGRALDLGAAPGGWTRILRQHAMSVVAVDPADLDPRIASDPMVQHVRQTSQAYLPTTSEPFSVILNDMRMDARDAARIMLLAAANLEGDGWALSTLKLPQKGLARIAAQALELLAQRYVVVGARQLFHNRTEITVALRKRD